MAEIELTQVPEERRTTAVFLGKDRHRRATGAKNNVYYTAMPECRNMATEEYPCAAVRRTRLTVWNRTKSGEDIDCLPAQLADAVNAGQHIAWLTVNGDVFCGPRSWSDSAAVNAGRLVPFGRGLFVTGTGLYIRSTEPTEAETLSGTNARHAAMKAECPFYVYAAVTDDDGYTPVTNLQSEAPVSGMQQGDLYYNTTDEGVYLYDGSAWTAQPFYHMGYIVNTTGMTTAEKQALSDQLTALSAGDRIRVRANDDEETAEELCWKTVAAVGVHVADPDDPSDRDNIYLIVRDVGDVVYPSVMITVQRRFPVIDLAVAHDNRIWGCRYGQNDEGEFVNEIYACRLGDPLNWFCYDGTEEASFTASVGEPGAWTGVAVVSDNVVFFKENCMLTVYGSSPSSYTTQLTYCPGIANGSDRSAVLINGGLYYHSPKGIMRLYSGSLPIQISDDISYKNIWHNAVGGTDGRKYYVRMMTDGDYSRLYVYDTATALWQIEDAELWTVCMVPFNNELLDICSPWTETPGEEIEKYWVKCVYISAPEAMSSAITNTYLCVKTQTGYLLPGQYTAGAMGISAENRVEWQFETGDFGHETDVYKRVKSIAVRAWLETGAAFEISVMYDEDGKWYQLEKSATIRNGTTGTTRVEYRLRRCDLYRLRFIGTGKAVFYSITHVYDGTGDRSYG